MLRDRPQLVLAVIDVESAFDPFAVSSAGAVGLMQVMPFWPTELGLSRKDLIDVELNIRMGTSILAYYLERERGNYRRALGRYNGSLGRREYPDLVLGRLNSRWRREGDAPLLTTRRPRKSVRPLFLVLEESFGPFPATRAR